MLGVSSDELLLPDEVLAGCRLGDLLGAGGAGGGVTRTARLVGRTVGFAGLGVGLAVGRLCTMGAATTFGGVVRMIVRLGADTFGGAAVARLTVGVRVGEGVGAVRIAVRLPEPEFDREVVRLGVD